MKVKNTGDKARNLSLFSYLEFSFHHIMIDNQNYQMSLYCAGASYEDGIIEEDLFYEEEGYQYFTADFAPDGFDCMRDKFLGTYNTETNPAAVIAGQCFSSYEKGGNHCGSLQKNVTLQPGEEVRFIFMLGEGRRDEGRRIRAKYADHGAVDAAREELKNFWEEKCSKLQVQTPNDGMNALLNTWTLYQSEINVMFSRFASFIEVGGRVGLGYRDTAQDAMTIPHSNPGKCRERIEQLLRGLTSAGYGLHLFQPEWFIRGITAKGKKIGTQADTEGRVHLESNAWAVLSGAADEEKADKALAAIDQYLYTPYGLLLNTPSYTVPDDDIGFVTRVYPGVKENGAIFSHPNPWAWAAACMRGMGDLAMKFYDALCPYHQNDQIEMRESEPYSYCQFVMGRDHSAYGRARHPFMTGSGGWSYFSATRYILGIRPDYDSLTVDPCIPADWKAFDAVRVWRGAIYELRVSNPDGVMKGVKEIKVDGVKTDKILPMEAGSRHTVEVVMGV